MGTHSQFILCVDDESLPLTLRRLVLEKHGYQVITAMSAAEAIEILETSHVDLVLTDHLMPGGTGTQLARKIKQTWPGLPVILISGVNEIPSDANHADLFISKVEGPAAMCEKISAVLSRGRSPQETIKPVAENP